MALSVFHRPSASPLQSSHYWGLAPHTSTSLSCFFNISKTIPILPSPREIRSYLHQSIEQFFFLLGKRYQGGVEDGVYDPGLGQIIVSLTTLIPTRTLAPPSTPTPLCISTPTVLNCSALTSTCHLPLPSSLCWCPAPPFTQLPLRHYQPP